MKGGHNAENHNHNDVGSFVVALGRSTPLVDPGSEVYTARTFGPHRYDSNVLNSFGHPRAARGRAVAGRGAAGRRPRREDRIHRESRYARARHRLGLSRQGTEEAGADVRLLAQGRGTLTVTDAVEFSSPQTFGTALITFSQWKRTAPDRLQVGDGRRCGRVEIHVDGGEFQIAPETIHEHFRNSAVPIRLGIELMKPVAAATIRVDCAEVVGAPACRLGWHAQSAVMGVGAARARLSLRSGTCHPPQRGRRAGDG